MAGNQITAVALLKTVIYKVLILMMKRFTSYYAALEHPVPLVPNIKLKYTELE